MEMDVFLFPFRSVWSSVMRLGLVLSVLALGLAVPASPRLAAASSPVSATQFGTPSDDQVFGVAADATGNLYVVGFTNGTLPGQTSAGDYDAFVRKYDPAGTVVWTRQFGSASIDRGISIAVDSTGVYVSGEVRAQLENLPYVGGSDAFVRKYDPQGNVQWTQMTGTSSTEYGSAIAVDASGVYLAALYAGGQVLVRRYDTSGAPGWTREFSLGGYTDPTGIAVSGGSVYVIGGVIGNGYDVFIRSYSTDGTEGWTDQFGGPGDQQPQGIVADATGVYVAGYASGALSGQTSAGGSLDAFVRRYNPNGTVVWTRQFGTSADDALQGIATDATGVYVVGNTNGTFPGQSSSGALDTFVRQYDANGTELWTRQFGTAGNESARGIAVHATKPYVGGSTSGAFAGYTNAGSIDGFIAGVMGPNQAPSVSAPASVSGNEGVAIALTGSAQDPDSPNLTVTWSVSVGCTVANASAASTSVTCADNGTYTAVLTANDGVNPPATATTTVNVANGAPSATFSAPTGAVNEGGTFSLSLSAPQDVAADLPGLTYAFDCGTGSGYGQASTTSTASCATIENGTRTVKGKILDKDAGVTEYTGSVTVTNSAPTPTITGAPTASVTEGTTVNLTGSATDPSSADTTAGFTYAWSVTKNGVAFGSGGTGATFNVTTDDNGTYVVTLKATDKDGGNNTTTTTINATNVGPTITGLTGLPTNPVALCAATVQPTVAFTDPGTADTHSVSWNWDDGTTSVGSVTESNGVGSATGSRTYTTAGIYTIQATVTDKDGVVATATAPSYVVVYDPNAGFVTGGGTIVSPQGAYAKDPTLTGPASFGFVAKYQKGATAPQGNTEFQFHLGNFRFESTSYDWLVPAGARAQFKGSGTVNGTGSYGFLLTAIDGALPGSGDGKDKFRIKIWDKASNAVVYDNQLGQAEDSDAATAISNGQIMIHAK